VLNMSVELILGIFGVAAFASSLGAMLGLGGGILLIPFLTVFFGIDLRLAVAASLLAVIANSNVATLRNSRLSLYDKRLASVLEFPAVLGALVGSVCVVWIAQSYLYYLFSFVTFYVVVLLLRSKTENLSEGERRQNKTLFVSVVAFVAGILSGLLGVGGGILLLPLMNLAMKMPMRQAVATSSLMLGATGAVGALVYWIRGDMKSDLVVPVVLGSMLGAWVGASFLARAKPQFVKALFIVLCIWVGLQMFWKGYQV
jgi:uncharacterized protein